MGALRGYYISCHPRETSIAIYLLADLGLNSTHIEYIVYPKRLNYSKS